jgi:hypothetical protein
MLWEVNRKLMELVGSYILQNQTRRPTESRSGKIIDGNEHLWFRYASYTMTRSMPEPLYFIGNPMPTQHSTSNIKGIISIKIDASDYHRYSRYTEKISRDVEIQTNQFTVKGTIDRIDFTTYKGENVADLIMMFNEISLFETKERVVML